MMLHLANSPIRPEGKGGARGAYVGIVYGGAIKATDRRHADKVIPSSFFPLPRHIAVFTESKTCVDEGNAR